MDLATVRHLGHVFVVYVVANTKSSDGCCIFSRPELQRIYGLGYSSTAHGVDAGCGVGIEIFWVALACPPAFIVRSDCGVDCRSLGFDASRILVELYGRVDFVCVLDIFSVLAFAYQGAIFDECLYGTLMPVIFPSSLLGWIFRKPCSCAMGHLCGDSLVHVGLADSVGVEPGSLGYIGIGTMPGLAGESLLGAMVCTSCTPLVRCAEHCRHVGICDACCLVVEAFRCTVFLACPQLASA